MVASGIHSWNTGEVVFDDSVGYGLHPLKTVEMERAMDMPDDFTGGFGLPEVKRHHMIGNAFHAGVLEHILGCWVQHVRAHRKFDSTKGFPGEGPKSRAAARLARKFAKSSTRNVAASGGLVSTPQITRKKSKPRSKRAAAWRRSLPATQMDLPASGTVLECLGGVHSWGSATLSVLPKAGIAGVKVPVGDEFAAFAAALRRDFLLSARSEDTWKSYGAWVECFFAWCWVFKVPMEPSLQNQSRWVDVLTVSTAILSLSYAAGSLRVTMVIKDLYKGLARHKGLDEEWAAHFSGKSMRCGGVSEAAGAAVRDGVLQGHGGWLQRQSLVHYDLMRPSERGDVSSAIGARVQAYVEGKL